MLTEALKCAQRAVKLDLAKSDLPLAVVAYEEAISILQDVIARRSEKPGIMSEVERVTSIHDRYAERVRELCRAHHIPLPSHVPPTAGGFSPSMITSPLPPLDPPPQDRFPDTALATHNGTNPSSKFEYRSSSFPKGDETESESEPQLSRSPSTTPSTSETPLLTPADDCVLDGRRWVLSEAREEELKEWGQYLGEAATANCRLSALTAASSSSPMHG